MDPELVAKAREALAAWQTGDVAALEPLLAPEVELLWWKPGDGDCHGRDAVLATLRDRVRRGAGNARVYLIEAGDALVVARRGTAREGPETGTQPATLVMFKEGKVVSMRQFRSREEALVAACNGESS